MEDEVKEMLREGETITELVEATRKALRMTSEDVIEMHRKDKGEMVCSPTPHTLHSTLSTPLKPPLPVDN